MTASAHAAGNHRHETLKLGMWLFLASEIMMFGGFLAAYILLRTANDMAEDAAHLNRMLAAVNTLVLIGSSFTMALAVDASAKGDPARAKKFLGFTIALAACFLVIKGIEYSAKFDHEIYPWTSIFFTCYFSMTGLHGLHVVGGIVVLSILALKSNASAGSIEAAGLYWHFVDVVWIFLFPLLYLL